MSAFRWHPAEKDRISLGPDVLHEDIQKFCDEIELAHWLPHEIRYDEDRRQWDSGLIDDNVKRLVEHILGFFSIADQLVINNIGDNFSREIAEGCLDVQHVYIAIAEQERIHAKTYKAQPEALYSDRRNLVRILDAARTMPIIAEMVNWIKLFMNDDIYIGDRLVAFVVVEGIWFTGSFCLLQWLRQKHLLPGITQANEWISRDEGIHVRFACHLIKNYLVNKPSYEKAKEIMESGLVVADKFTNEAIPSALVGMSADLMSQYLKYQTDCVMVEMGYPIIYGVENPFKFMVNLCLKKKVDFFVRNSTQYQSINDPSELEFGIDDSPIEL